MTGPTARDELRALQRRFASVARHDPGMDGGRWAVGDPQAICDIARDALALAAARSEAPGELDAAWQEAEAALPPGWELRSLFHEEDGMWSAIAAMDVIAVVRVQADTPAAALSALAARLREARS